MNIKIRLGTFGLKIGWLFLLLSMVSFTTGNTGGKVYISGSYKNGNTSDTISVKYFKFFFYHTQSAPDSTFKIIVKNSSFNFQLEHLSNPGYLQILSSKNPSLQIINYVIEPGDKLHILVLKDSLKFSGIGSVKYTCQYLISKISNQIWNSEELNKLLARRRIQLNKEDEYLLLTEIEHRFDSLLHLRLNVIDAFKNKISKKTRILMKLNCEGDRYFETYSRSFTGLFNDVKNEADSEMILRFYDNYIKNIALDTAEENIIYSRSYPLALFWKNWVDVKVQVNRNRMLNMKLVSFAEFYSFIKNEYHGTLKERMIIETYSELSSARPDASNFFDDAINSINRISYFKTAILNLADKSKIGAIAFNFSLKDTAERIIKLSNFYGKIVLIDCWFTGCGACMESSVAKAEVINEFKTNKDVVFITISIDENFQQWKTSIIGGKYTWPEEINLYTNGSGYEHPFIEYYQIMSYPKYLLIDAKGKIISINPPIPWPNSNRGNQLIELIKCQLPTKSN